MSSTSQWSLNPGVSRMLSTSWAGGTENLQGEEVAHCRKWGSGGPLTASLLSCEPWEICLQSFGG